jgi:hypothetical protein
MQDLSRYRQRIIDDAVERFKGDNIFPDNDVVLAACEGLLDLLMEPADARDPHVVKRFMEWVYNLIRRQSLKTDTTLEFLDTFASIVKRPLDNREDQDIDAFFELCREIIREKHKELARHT